MQPTTWHLSYFEGSKISIFQREEAYFVFLGTFDHCYNPTQHSNIISNNICVNKLRNEPEVDYTHLVTTEKACMGYIITIISYFRDISSPCEMPISQ